MTTSLSIIFPIVTPLKLGNSARFSMEPGDSFGVQQTRMQPRNETRKMRTRFVYSREMSRPKTLDLSQSLSTSRRLRAAKRLALAREV